MREETGQGVFLKLAKIKLTFIGIHQIPRKANKKINNLSLAEFQDPMS
jgi:hypothetical protein